MKAAITFIILSAAAVIYIGCSGCSSNVKPLPTPSQMAATRPAAHPITNVETVIAHTQTALTIINIPAFIAALAGLGLVVYGLFTSNNPLERIGLLIAAIAGAVAAGTLIGILTLPFLPWVIVGAATLGQAYGAYLLYRRLFVKKATTPPTLIGPVTHVS